MLNSFPFAVVLAVGLIVGIISKAGAEDYVGYSALDQSQSISFDGKTVTWNGKTFTLDENTLFLDYRLDRAKLAGNPFAFNNLNDVAKALKNGTAEKPMLLLTAPGSTGWTIPTIPRSAATAPLRRSA